ncbi:uncharacterized protein [Oscarella lobularis]|uniref:uncharacterized protein isoform X2 n=1 Tax=Oscarella lobularis TaxID=121494 RepID=UPI003313F10A
MISTLFPLCACLFCFCQGKERLFSFSIAKSIRYEVTNAASQEFFVADGGVVTLSYQYRGNNTVDSFSWVTFSPVTKIADFGLASNAVPPYSVTGSLAEGRTNLMITSVNTSLSGKVYQCSVILLLSNTVRSGPAKLSLKDLPVLSANLSSGEIVTIGRPFLIRINVTQGDDAVVNLTTNGRLLQLIGTGNLYEHNITQVKASTNGTYVAIGDNNVGYYQVRFTLLAFYLGEARCNITAKSTANSTVTCTIKSFPPVDKGTYACRNQSVDLTWKEMESADILGVHEYQAKASMANMDGLMFIETCKLTTANKYGQFSETLKAALHLTSSPSTAPTTNSFTTVTGYSSDTAVNVSPDSRFKNLQLHWTCCSNWSSGCFTHTCWWFCLIPATHSLEDTKARRASSE